MLVAVFSGRDRPSASLTGNLHFDRSPDRGDQVEIQGELLVVMKAWHMPDSPLSEPKFGILVRSEIVQPTEEPRRDDAGNII